MMTSEDVDRIVRGPADLEERIEQLERDNEILIKDIDRLSEDKYNLETMLKK